MYHSRESQKFGIPYMEFHGIPSSFSLRNSTLFNVNSEEVRKYRSKYSSGILYQRNTVDTLQVMEFHTKTKCHIRANRGWMSGYCNKTPPLNPETVRIGIGMSEGRYFTGKNVTANVSSGSKCHQDVQWMDVLQGIENSTS